MRIRIEHIRHLRGGGRHLDMKKRIIESMEHLRAKKCVKVPHEDLAPACCGPACLLFALALERGEKKFVEKFEHCSRKVKMAFDRECFTLMRKGGVRNPTALPEGATLSLAQLKDIIEKNEDLFSSYADCIFLSAKQ